MPSPFYTFSAPLDNGELFSFSHLTGKVVLIVNVASYCAFTRQYAGLEALYQRFHAHGFTILAFPCNQFGQQEPGTSHDIRQFCESNYAISFPLMAKINVNGSQEHPLYTWLKQQQSGLFSPSIKWNFSKFLIDKKGNVKHRFSPITTPARLANAIQALLIQA